MPDTTITDTSSRRIFLTRIGVGTLAIGAVSVLQACGKKEGEGAAPKCDDTTGLSDADKALRTSLKYMDKSPEATKSCKVCLQFTPPEGGAACGGCKLFKGTVSPEGYCNGFAAKV